MQMDKFSSYNEIKNFIDNNLILGHRLKVYAIQLSVDSPKILSRYPCFVAFYDKTPIIYNNPNLFIFYKYQEHKNKNKLINIIHKLKIIPFSNKVRSELSIDATFNIIDEDEVIFLNSIFEKYENEISNDGIKKYNIFLNFITKLIFFSVIYENTMTDRIFQNLQFQSINNFIKFEQLVGLTISELTTCFSPENSLFFIEKSPMKEDSFLFENEKIFVQCLNKFKENKFKFFKFEAEKNIRYESYFPIADSYFDLKKNRILSEYVPNDNIFYRYSQGKRKTLIEKFILAINIIRSINLIHSLGFIFNEAQPGNYFFRNSKSKVPILLLTSAVMPMKMKSNNDKSFLNNEIKSFDLGATDFFSYEKCNPSENKTLSFFIDVFSFGMFFYYIIMEKMPIESTGQVLTIESIKNKNLPLLKKELKNLKTTENNDLYNLQEDDIDAIDTLYMNCTNFDKKQRWKIRQVGYYIIEFIQNILKKDYIQQNYDQNDLIILKNCMLGLIDELSSPIPFVIGLSDSYYAYSSTNELENFNFFLIDDEIILDSALYYILQIKLTNFGTFHFDKADTQIQSLTLCIEKYVIIVRNKGNLIHDFIKKFYANLKQIKLIPSTSDDNSILKNGGFLDEGDANELLLIEYKEVNELIEQIEKAILPHIERKSEDLREPKIYSLVPLISYLIIYHYFNQSIKDEYKNMSWNSILEIKLDGKNLFFDQESFLLMTLEKETETETKIDNKSSNLLQEVLINEPDYKLYQYFPYDKKNDYVKLNDDKLYIIFYGLFYALNYLNNCKFYIKSLNFSDLYIYPNKNVLDFNIRMHDNLMPFQNDSDCSNNYDKLIRFIEKAELKELLLFIQEYEKNLTFEFINNYLYIKHASAINNSIRNNLTNLLKISFDLLPSKFNRKVLFPSGFLGYYENNIFNFDFYNMSYINVNDIIEQTQKLPFVTYEFVNDDQDFIACIENKAFFMKNIKNSREQINQFFTSIFKKNSKVKLIPIKQSDKESIHQEIPQNNFFNKLKQETIQENIEKIKQQIYLQIKEKNRFSQYSSYSSFIDDFLKDFFLILSPVVGYTFFRHYFPSNEFEDSSFFLFPKESPTSLINFSTEIDNMIEITLIGSGSTSFIYLCCHLPTLHPLISKDYNLSMLNYFYNEKKIGEEIKKKNVKNNLAKFYGYIDKRNRKSIIMQFYPNGSLDDYKIDSEFTIDQKKEMRDNIMNNGINVLHDLNYNHNDIKPSNILLDNNFCPVLTDFNLSRKMNSHKDDIESLKEII